MGVLTLARGGRSLKYDDPSLQVRVLVVDDHEPFRRFVASALEKQPSLHIIGEAQDGINAIHQAEALQPDLILLDIGLPGLNGIEVARRIGQTCSASRIIFLTQESSADIVREAFNAGARGYVVKIQAAKELLIAVETVLRGKQFVSTGLESARRRQHRLAAGFCVNARKSLAPSWESFLRNHETGSSTRNQTSTLAVQPVSELCW